MPRALVHFPNIPMNAIESLRQQYDPTASLIRAHITIVFPTPATVTESHLLDHTRGVLSRWQPFDIRFHGFHALLGPVALSHPRRRQR